MLSPPERLDAQEQTRRRVASVVVPVFVALGVVIVVMTRPPTWLEARPGCDVRNIHDGKQWRRANTTTVTWSGDCVDGRAQGVGSLDWFRDGVNSVHYEGEMSNGRITGRGELIEGGVRQRGVFENAEFKEGSAIYRDGRRYAGRWYKGSWTKGVLTGPGGRRMDGRWYEGRMTGVGIAEGPEGRYEGNWYKGKPEGKGVFVARSGERYEGKWHDGKLVEPAPAPSPPPLDCLWSMAARVYGDRSSGAFPMRCPSK